MYWLKTLGPIFSAIVALAIAIFHSQISTFFWKPRLKITINKKDPADCHKTTIMNKETKLTADCFYFRLKILNEGNATAENVEVIVQEISKKNLSNDQFEKWEDFLPLNAKWANTPLWYFPRISPQGIYKHCDFAHIIDPAQLASLENKDAIISDKYVNKEILILDLVSRPFTGTYILGPGTYRIGVIAAASNAKPVYKTVELNFIKWYADPKKMLDDGIDIKMEG